MKAAPVSQQAGFTLLEVLVALGIAASSLITLYSLANQLNMSSAALDLRQWALWCADNRLIEASLRRPMQAVAQTESVCNQSGQAFVVVQNITATPNPTMQRIEIDVYLQGRNRDERLAFLATVLPVQGATP